MLEIRRSWLGVALVGLGVLWPTAQARADVTAGELMRACSEIERQGRVLGPRVDVPDTAPAGLCLGYVMALLGATLFANADDSRVLGICTPENLNAFDLVRATARFLRDNPGHDRDRAVVVVLSAARQAYPCRAV